MSPPHRICRVRSAPIRTQSAVVSGDVCLRVYVPKNVPTAYGSRLTACSHLLAAGYDIRTVQQLVRRNVALSDISRAATLMSRKTMRFGVCFHG